jgi:hypothetical protein
MTLLVLNFAVLILHAKASSGLYRPLRIHSVSKSAEFRLMNNITALFMCLDLVSSGLLPGGRPPGVVAMSLICPGYGVQRGREIWFRRNASFDLVRRCSVL